MCLNVGFEKKTHFLNYNSALNFAFFSYATSRSLSIRFVFALLVSVFVCVYLAGFFLPISVYTICIITSILKPVDKKAHAFDKLKNTKKRN